MHGAEGCPPLGDVEEPPVMSGLRSALEPERLELEVIEAGRIEADRRERGCVRPLTLFDDHLDREQGGIDVGHGEERAAPVSGISLGHLLLRVAGKRLVPQTGELQIFVSIPGDLLIELVFDADPLPPN